jgi:hypothetical protein
MGRVCGSSMVGDRILEIVTRSEIRRILRFFQDAIGGIMRFFSKGFWAI